MQLAATATDIGGGKFRYVYSLMNHDFDPQVGSFSMPINDLVTIEDLRFSDGDSDAANDWSVFIGWGQATWTATTAATRLAWGTAVTVSFTASSPPIRNFAQISRSDSGTVFSLKTIAPGPPVQTVH